MGGNQPIAVVFGTRPELIKLAGVVQGLGPRARTIHTGQHFDAAMSSEFLDELGLDEPTVQLEVGGQSRGQQIGRATELLDRYFAELSPAAVVVQGDTNATLAGALAANAREIPLVHLEAGLRSHDRRMPEEHNRVLADHLADLCLAPTPGNRDNLLREDIDPSRIQVTGNTIVDAVNELLPEQGERLARLHARGLEPSRYILSTLHRPENVDDQNQFSVLLESLAALDLPVVLPMHPRAAVRAEQFGLMGALSRLTTVEPVGYRDFLTLLAECALAVSDSGGVMEEASIVKRPVIVVRRSTERPEVLGIFAELVEDGAAMVAAVERWLDQGEALNDRLSRCESPYGHGGEAKRCASSVLEIAGTGASTSASS